MRISHVFATQLPSKPQATRTHGSSAKPLVTAVYVHVCDHVYFALSCRNTGCMSDDTGYFAHVREVVGCVMELDPLQFAKGVEKSELPSRVREYFQPHSSSIHAEPTRLWPSRLCIQCTARPCLLASILMSPDVKHQFVKERGSFVCCFFALKSVFVRTRWLTPISAQQADFNKHIVLNVSKNRQDGLCSSHVDLKFLLLNSNVSLVLNVLKMSIDLHNAGTN